MASWLRKFIAGKDIDPYEFDVKTGGRRKNPDKAVQQFETNLKTVDDLDEPLDKAVVEDSAERGLAGRHLHDGGEGDGCPSY